jgi:CDP-diacylglycerol--serine O-phosphatidyltransferase
MNKFFRLASLLIVAAVITDGLDGKVARLTNTSSAFGIQYDSLADLVAFGVAPSVLLYSRYLADLPAGFIVVPFLFLIMGAVRLARFNVTTDGKKKNCFYGLPIPSAGGGIASYTLFIDFLKEHQFIAGTAAQINSIIIGLALISATLMVSTIEFDVVYKFYFRNFSAPVKVAIFLVCFAGLVVYPGPTLFSMWIVYIIEAVTKCAWKHIIQKKESIDNELDDELKVKY